MRFVPEIHSCVQASDFHVSSVHVPRAKIPFEEFWQRPLERQVAASGQQKVGKLPVSQGRSVVEDPFGV